MTALKPAGELRAAANLMRQRAMDATPGPWQHMCLGSEGCLVLREHGTLRERRQGRVARFGQKDWKADHADASYVMAMHPGVALAVAAWLESVAKDADDCLTWDWPEGPCCAEPSVCGGHAPDWGCDRCGNFLGPGEMRCTCWDAPLAVARALAGYNTQAVLRPEAVQP